MSYLTPDALAAVRRRREDELTLVAFLLGLVAVLVTTLVPAIPPGTGLVVGGLLVGVAAGSLGRAAQLGCYFGGLVLVAWGVVLVLFGVFGAVATATPLSLLALVLGVALPTLAAVTVRGLV
ncbi:hypothetical protein [Haloglomus halophilum]|uniref:hypothetical protein n=1 Tax=Haloglomus halophilum TaxID=2962672 RepID=UPI0020C98E7B|nr:hypothetical protein [Haloglomus halophilum]